MSKRLCCKMKSLNSYLNLLLSVSVLKSSRPQWLSEFVNHLHNYSALLLKKTMNIINRNVRDWMMDERQITPTFSSKCVSLVCLEEWSGGWSWSQTVHLPPLDTLALTTWCQSWPGGPGHSGRHWAHATLLKLENISVLCVSQLTNLGCRHTGRVQA